MNMKKNTFIIVMVSICILCGCSSKQNASNVTSSDESYENGYNDGYEHGYSKGFEKGLIENDCIGDVDSFHKVIVTLMYDREYEVVEKLLEYYPDDIAIALENEFGANNLTSIIDYLEESSQTITGNCEICGEPVYADEFAFLPEGINCAHNKCISNGNY